MKVRKAPLKEFENILNSSTPCVVKFANDGCHLCVNLTPVYAKLAKKYSGKIDFFEVDTFEEKKLTEIFSDDGVPTIYFFVNGDAAEIPYPEDLHSGYSKESLEEFFNDFLEGNIVIKWGKKWKQHMT